MIQVDRHTIIQILGSLMNKPELLNETDKYLLEPADFHLQLDKFIFSAIYNLYLNGAEKIHVSDIDNYLKENSLAKKLVEEENGIGFLQDCETQCEVNNFNYYYNKLKKINLIRDLQLSKDKIDNIYCEDILNDNYTEINNNFEKMQTIDIVNILKSNIANLENRYVLNNLAEESKASEGIRDLLVDLKKKPEIGCKLQGDIFNTICRGGRKGKLYIRSAGSGVGKCIPNYTKIPTPNGWTTVGEVKVGDYLFDRFGKPTKVLAVYPQQEKKQIFRVYFKSGRIAECCEEHLWSYYSNLNDKNPNKLMTSTLKEIIDNPKGLQNNKKQYRWSVPICEPVNYNVKQYSVDPYVMGLILGNGSFRYTKKQKGFIFSSSDEEIVKEIKNRMNYKLYKKNSQKNYNWMFELNNDNCHKNVWVEDILKDYPELWQVKSEDKFIPQDYLFGSIEQRFNLLAGLLDTDGSIDKRGRVSYTTVSPYLRDNLIELCESLGMTCWVEEDKRDKYTTGVAYIIHIRASKYTKLHLFKLNRKKEIAQNYFNNDKRTERRDRDSIVKIEATDIYTDMTCFYVDNKEHLFLMNNFICTHNTRSMVGDACHIAYPIRYEPKLGKWISTGSCEKVLYVMTEQDTEEIKTMILAYLTGYNEEIFLYGTYGDDEMERINIAVEIMEKFSDNMLFAKVSDPCSSIIKNLFRRYNLQYGVENFFYDYIFSSPAMLDEYRDLKIQEHVALRMFTTTLKNLAVELNAFILTSTQLNSDDDPNGGFKDFRNIRGSKAIIDLADFACIMSRPTIDELNQISEFKKSFGFTPNLVTDIYKNRRGRWNMVRIWSLNDLGTCRKNDLFITTANMKEVTDFIIIDFKPYEQNNEFLRNIEKIYNTRIVESNLSLVKVNNEEETDLLEAFGDINDRLIKIKDKDISDLL